MSTSKTTVKNDDALALEMRKVKALEKIANTLDALTIWVEEIDKEEWGDRIQYYLSEFHIMASPSGKLTPTKIVPTKIVKVQDEDDEFNSKD